MDPFARSGADSPYAFYGLAPTLFDAPSRDHRDDLDWLAHAFLAHTPLGTNAVEAVLGFSWGFTFQEEKMQIIGPSPLDHADCAAQSGRAAPRDRSLSLMASSRRNLRFGA